AVTLFLLSFAAVTPPFQAPDEVGHYWRACALARGTVLPSMEGGRPSALIARGERDLVAVLWVGTVGQSGEAAKVGTARLHDAQRVELHNDEPVRVMFPAQSTAFAYVPQAAVCWIGKQLDIRPLYSFYLGRLANVACVIALLAFALRHMASPWPMLAIAGLPMLAFVCGSFSPDAMTIGLAFLVTSLAFSPPRSMRGWIAFCCLAFALALCKPAYFLLPLIAITRIGVEQRVLRLAMLAAVIVAGVAISASTVRRNFYPMRTDVPVDPTAQTEVIEQAPMRFARIVVNDYWTRGHEYARQFVGTLGWLDVPLPHWLTDLTLILLLCVNVTAAVDVRMQDRIVLIAIVALTAVWISTTQYLAWNMIGGDQLDGIQGRTSCRLRPH
ncbi:MAG TPA: DUF2142 domain-containing protein, partial [Thermoanaerobaculia bacterium]